MASSLYSDAQSGFDGFTIEPCRILNTLQVGSVNRNQLHKKSEKVRYHLSRAWMVTCTLLPVHSTRKAGAGDALSQSSRRLCHRQYLVLYAVRFAGRRDEARTKDRPPVPSEQGLPTWVESQILLFEQRACSGIYTPQSTRRRTRCPRRPSHLSPRIIWVQEEQRDGEQVSWPCRGRCRPSPCPRIILPAPLTNCFG